MQNFSTETMSQEAFMRTVEQDANRRYQEKEERNQNWNKLKKSAKAAFNEGKYEKALSLYNQVSEVTQYL